MLTVDLSSGPELKRWKELEEGQGIDGLPVELPNLLQLMLLLLLLLVPLIHPFLRRRRDGGMTIKGRKAIMQDNCASFTEGVRGNAKDSNERSVRLLLSVYVCVCVEGWATQRQPSII